LVCLLQATVQTLNKHLQLQDIFAQPDTDPPQLES